MGAELSGVGSLNSAVDRIANRWTGHYVYETVTGVEHALYVEYGTSRHDITPDTAEVLHFYVDGVEVFTEFVDHPGTDPQPFMRPAAETAARGAGLVAVESDGLEEFTEGLADLVRHIARDLAPMDDGELVMSIRVRRLV